MKKIIIYGAGRRGIHLLDLIKDNDLGLEVDCFCDQKASSNFDFVGGVQRCNI